MGKYNDIQISALKDLFFKENDIFAFYAKYFTKDVVNYMISKMGMNMRNKYNLYLNDLLSNVSFKFEHHKSPKIHNLYVHLLIGICRFISCIPDKSLIGYCLSNCSNKSYFYEFIYYDKTYDNKLTIKHFMTEKIILTINDKESMDILLDKNNESYFSVGNLCIDSNGLELIVSAFENTEPLNI